MNDSVNMSFICFQDFRRVIQFYYILLFFAKNLGFEGTLNISASPNKSIPINHVLNLPTSTYSRNIFSNKLIIYSYLTKRNQASKLNPYLTTIKSLLEERAV